MNKSILQAIVLIFLLLPQLSFAKIPQFEQSVHLEVNREHPNKFLKSLFDQIGVPVKIDGEIVGEVDGIFSGTAADVFKQFSDRFNAYVYFNHTVAYVYLADDIVEKSLPMSNRRASEIIRIVDGLNITDSNNQIFVVGGEGLGLDVVGNRRFVQRVESLNNNLVMKARPKSAKKSVAQVASKVTGGQLIFKEFKLKYASVIDKTQVIAGREVTIPGVATLLRQFSENKRASGSVIVASRNDDSGQNLETSTNNATKNTSAQRRRHAASDTQVRILAYPQTNSLYIEDTADRMAIYQSMIYAMDQKPRMVEVEVTIIDINNSKYRELGVNWRAKNGVNDFLVGDGTGNDQLLNLGQQITPIGEGGILSLVLGDRTKFIARMRALQTEGAAKIVSKPHITTYSNIEASVASIHNFFVKLEGRDAVSLEEKSYGTVLTVTPRVFEDGARDGIDLHVSIEDGEASGDQVDGLPEVTQTVVGTNAMIMEGQSLLLGGLIRESTVDSVTKVPLVGDIPLFGKLFRTEGHRVIRTERLFLLTPKVVGNSNGYAEAGPILQGAITDIINSSDERLSNTDDEIDLKAERQTLAVVNPAKANRPVPMLKQANVSSSYHSGAVANANLQDLLIVPELNSANQTVDVKKVAAQPMTVKTWAAKSVDAPSSQWGVQSY